VFYKGKRYIYIGYVARTHGKKGKIAVRIRKRIPKEKMPPRIFIKEIKEDGEELKEYRLKLLKEYKNGLAIMKLNIKPEESEKLVSQDVYICEDDLPRKVRVELGVIPSFIPEVEKDESELEDIGFITKPRGLQGALAVVSPKEKESIWKKEKLKIFIEGDEKGKFFETQIRSVKKLREMLDNVYLSVKVLYVNDIDAAERLRKRRIFISKADLL
jgi:ribosomal 30S subunit maturation factor RimM